LGVTQVGTQAADLRWSRPRHGKRMGARVLLYVLEESTWACSVCHFTVAPLCDLWVAMNGMSTASRGFITTAIASRTNTFVEHPLTKSIRAISER
jgi:hypothetical protein